MEIPIVDLKFLPGKETSDHNKLVVEEVSKKLDEVLRTHTCAFLTNTGVGPEIAEAIFAKSKTFFMLPEEVKGKYDKGGRDLGYYRSTRESFRERYDVGLKPCHLDELPEEEIPGIKAAVSDFKESMRNISRFVLRVVGNNLELKKNELIEAHTGALLEEENVSTKAHFSSIYYKPIPKAADDAVTVSETPEFLMQRHTDFSCITLLFATGPGLQVEIDGTWHDVDPVAGGIFLHVGDLLEIWTGKRYRATVHRVKHLQKGSLERQSLAYFLHPDAEAVVKPLIGEEVDGLQPVRAGDYFQMKMSSRPSKNLLIGNLPSTPPSC